VLSSRRTDVGLLWLNLAARLLAAGVWTGITAVRIRGNDRPLRTRLIQLDILILAVTWVLVIGGLGALGIIPGSIATVLYTAVDGLALVIGVSILTNGRERRA
jgi:hypothetical protein